MGLMERFLTAGVVRVTAALAAAAISIGICIAEHHVHIVFAQPGTYGNVFEHKCGDLMVVCVAWAVLEVVRQAGLPVRAAR